MCASQRYELEARIGKGVTGSVYRAYDLRLDRVAFKLHAVQVLARIAHRNVVAIHDCGHALGHEPASGVGIDHQLTMSAQRQLQTRPLNDRYGAIGAHGHTLCATSS
jgi:serine/threonine protein kinase